MKRLLVYLLCAMLVVPTVSTAVPVGGVLEVQAATDEELENFAKDAAEELENYYKGKDFTDAGEKDANAIMTYTASLLGFKKFDSDEVKFKDFDATMVSGKELNYFEDTVQIKKNEIDACQMEVDLQKEAVSILKKLVDYYKNSNFTSAEKTAADKVMNEAAEALGYKFDSTNIKFTDDPNKGLGRDSEEGLKALETSIKAKLDACKTQAPAAEPAETPDSNIIIGGKEYDTTVANAGNYCVIAVPLVNLGDTKVTDIVITPVLSADPLVWPFDIERTDYAQTHDKLKGEDSGEPVVERKHTFRWELRTRDDAVTGYTKLSFDVTYKEIDGTQKKISLDYYVQVNGVEPTASNGKISTPRVIVTGFTTTPEEVYAGDTFTLTLNLKNTSKETAVSNMLFDIQGTQEGTDSQNTYAAFLPTAGSSTIYVDSIAPNSSKNISIELKSKADLAQKPYVVTVNMEYEDKDTNAFTETASVSVPIKQQAKVDMSTVTLMPDYVEVGNEANVMFSIYNVGKTKLYNVNVKFQADSVTGGDTFLGNLDPGATGNVDVYLTAQAATMDDGTVKILVTYEDEEGKEAVIEKTMTLMVSEPYYEEFIDDPMMMEGMEPEKTGLPWWGYLLIGLGVAGAGVGAFFVIRKKKRAKLQAQAELEVIEALEDISEE